MLFLTRSMTMRVILAVWFSHFLHIIHVAFVLFTGKLTFHYTIKLLNINRIKQQTLNLLQNNLSQATVS